MTTGSSRHPRSRHEWSSTLRVGLALLIGLLVWVGCTGTDSPQDATPFRSMSEALYDHHVHLLSPTLVADWKSLGVPFSRRDEAYTSARVVLEETGAEGAFLVSMAHFYAHPELGAALGLTLEEQREKVRAENDWIAAEARALGPNVVAWCSVPVLRSYTWDELERCTRELESAGVKIHFASCGVDLREPEHLRELRSIAAWAEERDLPLLLHVDPQMRGHEAADIRNFIESVIAPHPRLRVIIAHLGGSGGYGPWTRSVFTTFIEWLEENPERAIWFDLSGAALVKESEGVPATTAEELEILAEDLRRAGPERILFATDYPLTGAVEYATFLQDRLPIASDELSVILRNRFPATEVGDSPEEHESTPLQDRGSRN